MFERYKKSLEECFTLLKQVQSDPDGEVLNANVLQQKLLKRIVQCETRIKQAKKQRDKIKLSLGDKNRRLTKEEAGRAKKRIKLLENFVETSHKLIWVYRDIGDGIAFTYINAFDIKPLAFKQSPGFISGKKGTRLERKALRWCEKPASVGIVVIMNDLTNCLRYGDITLAGSNQILHVEELKSGKGKRPTERDMRQMANLEKMMGYLKTDVTDRLYGQEGEFKRSEMSEVPQRHAEEINKLIQQSKKQGTSASSPEDGLAYFVSRDGELDVLSKVIKGWNAGWTVAFVNNLKYNNTGNYPFTLSLDDPFPFYNGDYMIGVAFDTSRFKSFLAQQDIELVSSTVPGAITAEINPELYPFCLKSKSGAFVGLSYHFVGRIFAEFISVGWFYTEAVRGFREVADRVDELGNLGTS